jgi:hypothetical protein
MIDYSYILTINYPNTKWVLNGDTYKGLTWLSDNIIKPTQDELDSLWESTQNQMINEKKQAEVTKQSALAKLSALGLTEDELKALIG